MQPGNMPGGFGGRGGQQPPGGFNRPPNGAPGQAPQFPNAPQFPGAPQPFPQTPAQPRRPGQQN
jgi:hypothetical protein